MKELSNFNIFKQQKTDDCWIACCKMTIDYIKQTSIVYKELCEKALTIKTDLQGSIKGISLLLEKYEIFYEYESSKKNLNEYSINIECSINSNYPVIIGLSRGHAVIVIGYDSQDNYKIADPNTGSYKIISGTTKIIDFSNN